VLDRLERALAAFRAEDNGAILRKALHLKACLHAQGESQIHERNEAAVAFNRLDRYVGA